MSAIARSLVNVVVGPIAQEEKVPINSEQSKIVSSAIRQNLWVLLLILPILSEYYIIMGQGLLSSLLRLPQNDGDS